MKVCIVASKRLNGGRTTSGEPNNIRQTVRLAVRLSVDLCQLAKGTIFETHTQKEYLIRRTTDGSTGNAQDRPISHGQVLFQLFSANCF